MNEQGHRSDASEGTPRARDGLTLCQLRSEIDRIRAYVDSSRSYIDNELFTICEAIDNHVDGPAEFGHEQRTEQVKFLVDDDRTQLTAASTPELPLVCTTADRPRHGLLKTWATSPRLRQLGIHYARHMSRRVAARILKEIIASVPSTALKAVLRARGIPVGDILEQRT